SGFVTIPKSLATPVQLGASGQLGGWPVIIFCFGLLLTIALMVRRIKGAILISIIASTILAIIVNTIFTVKSWGLVTPTLPHHVVGAPNFGLLGHFSVLGGFSQAGVI